MIIIFVKTNPNPNGVYVEDCVVRAISILTGKSWDNVYTELCLQGFIMKNMPSVNKVWGNYLYSLGFERYMLSNENDCKNCYSISDFCKDNPEGAFLLATGSHVVAVIDGDYYDAWDSGDEMPIEVWERRQ